MHIDFNIYKLKKDSKTYQHWAEKSYMQKELDCDIIVVGEEQIGDTLYLRCLTVGDKGVSLIGGLLLDESGYLVLEKELERTPNVGEYNIPKKYLNVRIIEGIQTINDRLMDENKGESNDINK